MRVQPEAPFTKGVHRFGWPAVHDALLEASDGCGVYLDDYVDATFGGRRKKTPHTEPWVGIFHYPREVLAPISMDKQLQVKRLLESSYNFRQSRKLLRGAICMSKDLAGYVKRWLQVPTIVIKHPTDLKCETWRGECDVLAQVGFFLRDVRKVFRVNSKSHVTYVRTTPRFDWVKSRDNRLRERYRKQEHNVVDEIPYLDAAGYDTLLASSVVLSHVYGASANNTVIECIARNVPIAVTRLPAIIEYLGSDYPLYYDLNDDPGAILDDRKRVIAAHEYLKVLDKSWCDVDVFVNQVREFTKQVDNG